MKNGFEFRKDILWAWLFCQFIPISLHAQQDCIQYQEFIFDSASFPQCHASTLVEIPGGIAAAWFGGTAERNPDVEIWFSKKIKYSWSCPVSVANGIQSSGRRFPCWNPVLFKAPDGSLLLFYKVGPNPDAWWGMMKRSGDNGDTWSPAVPLPKGILGPIKDKPVLLDQSILLCGSSTEDKGWKIHFELTPDLGKTWTISIPSIGEKKFQVIQPTLLQYGNHQLQALCRSKEGVIVTTWSMNDGRNWSELKPTDLPNPNSGIDAVTLNDGRQLLVYNHSTTGRNGNGGPRSPLNVAISTDGVHWSAIAVLEKDEGEYSYPAVIQTFDGKIHITYTWKRIRIRHAELDPSKFNPVPIVDKKWPE